MLIRPEIGFTYDCRQCERPVTARADLFSLQGKRWVRRCSCGESAMVACVEQGRLIVEYPCSLCGRRHRAEVPLDSVLADQIASFRCPVTDVAACYAGSPSRLSAMDSADSEEKVAALVRRLVGAHSEPSDPQPGDGPSRADILCAARALAERDAILCRCGSHRFTAAAEDGALIITCAVCGVSKTIPVGTISALAKIRGCGMLML